MQIRVQGRRYQFIRHEVDPESGKRQQTVILSFFTEKMPVEKDVVEHLSAQEMIDFEVWRANKLTMGNECADPLGRVLQAIRAAIEAMAVLPFSDVQQSEIESEIGQLEEVMLRLGYEP